MFEKITRKVAAEFDLCAEGPVLIGSGENNEINPTLPDTTFLAGKNGDTESFIVPGSSIKGVIRAGMFPEKNEQKEKEIFGAVQGGAQKSRLKFHDAYADMSTVTSSLRNQTAIDPLTQGAKGGSLRNMQVVEKGAFKAGFEFLNYTDEEMKLLKNTLSKVNAGIVRFGASTSRGFGVMSIKNFKLVITKGFDENLNPIVEREYNSFEEWEAE